MQEVLIGQNATAVGRTSKIWGSMTISDSTVTKATFTVDMASVVSDQSQRNAHFDGPDHGCEPVPDRHADPLDPHRPGHRSRRRGPWPTTTPRAISICMASRSRSRFPVTAERVGSGIDVLADIPITFSEWNIANPSIGGFVTTANSGTLEVLLHLTQGPGNPASQSSQSAGSAGSVGGGGPVTVPSTTVPPLRVPSG